MTDPTTTRARPLRRQPLIRLRPADRWAKYPMAELLVSWCKTPDDRTDARLQYQSSSCGHSVIGEWTLEPRMLDQYGPLPFTSRSKPIRWRWWHTLFGTARFTVYAVDVPDIGVRNE